MQNTHKKRICIVCRSLSEGGADRVAAMQSIFLTELGYTVYIVTILNSIAYPYKGQLYNLGEIKEKNDTFVGRLNRLFLLRKFLISNEIDMVIDHRVRNNFFSEHVISSFVFSKNTIYLIHSSAIERYLPPIKVLTKFLYNRSKYVVCVSEKIKNRIFKNYKFNNLKTIYNPIDFNYLESLKKETLKIDYDFIFWYGRFEEETKNLKLLLDAYNNSKIYKREFKLILMGNGKDKHIIKEKVKELDLENDVILLPFSKNPFKYVYKSRFTVLSSRYEGFPMTVLESLACGTPVVSVKYKNYEDGVLKDRYNGLLVDDNIDSLAEGFKVMINDQNLYIACRSNAKLSVEKFSVEHIAKQWEMIIEN